MPIIAVFIAVVVTATITSVICICFWKRREKRQLQFTHKTSTAIQEQKLEGVERGVPIDGCSKTFENSNHYDIDSNAIDSEVLMGMGDVSESELSSLLVNVR